MWPAPSARSACSRWRARRRARRAELTLEASSEITTMLPTFPNGCHACEVESRPRHRRGDDRALRRRSTMSGAWSTRCSSTGRRTAARCREWARRSPEDCVYDRDSGQLLSGSFMDYAMPRADMFPPSRSRTTRCRRRTIRSASRAPARAARPARRRPSSTRSSMRCASSACATWPCRRRRERIWRAIQQGRST